MMAAGFEIPLLFQKFFVGRSEVGGSLDEVKPRMERDRRVFAAKKAWSPREQVGKIMIPVQNTKTLDLSSKRWRRGTRPIPRQRLVRALRWKMRNIGDNKLKVEELVSSQEIGSMLTAASMTVR